VHLLGQCGPPHGDWSAWCFSDSGRKTKHSNRRSVGSLATRPARTIRPGSST
jgi:hypothetical protein